jgi:uncharacterized protein YvpB
MDNKYKWYKYNGELVRIVHIVTYNKKYVVVADILGRKVKIKKRRLRKIWFKKWRR